MNQAELTQIKTWFAELSDRDANAACEIMKRSFELTMTNVKRSLREVANIVYAFDDCKFPPKLTHLSR
jgi:hypothetical protein